MTRDIGHRGFMKIVISAPRSSVGRIVVRHLLGARHEVIIVSRHPEACADLIAQGARLVCRSQNGPEVLDRALTGATTLLWETPLTVKRRDHVEWACALAHGAARSASRRGVQRVVIVSSIGAQHVGCGPVDCCGPTELAFAKEVPSVCVLRAGTLMEELLAHVPSIVEEGAICTPHPSERAMPMVAARDVAEKAVLEILGANWSGFRLTGVHGPEDLSYARAACIIGASVRRPVRHVEISLEQARQALTARGMPEFAAKLVSEMHLGFIEGRLAPAESRTPETTTRTTLRHFAAAVLRPAIDGFKRQIEAQK